MDTVTLPRWEQLSTSSQDALRLAAGHAWSRSGPRMEASSVATTVRVASPDLLYGLSAIHGSRNELRMLLAHFGVGWDSFARLAGIEQGPGSASIQPIGAMPDLDDDAAIALRHAGRLAAIYPGRGEREPVIHARHLLGAVLESPGTAKVIESAIGGRLDGATLQDLRVEVEKGYLAPPDADLASVLERAFPQATQIPPRRTPRGAETNPPRESRPGADPTPPEVSQAETATTPGATTPTARFPEAKVARDYWTVDDHLGQRRYADAIASFVRHADTKPPLTIGIKGPWGAGKTSLMRMVQVRLDPPDTSAPTWSFKPLRLGLEAVKRLEGSAEAPRSGSTRGRLTLGRALERTRSASAEPLTLRDIDAALPVDQGEAAAASRAPASGDAHNARDWRATVWFNPWMYQTGEEVWAGLAHEIIQQVAGRLESADRERFWFELNRRRIDQYALRRRLYVLAIERLLPVVGVWLMLVVVAAIAGVQPWALATFLGAGAIGIPVVGGAFVAFQKLGDVLASLVKAPDPASLTKVVQDELKGITDEVMPEPGYRPKAGFLQLVQTDIRHVLDLVATPSRPVVIFVDDLDRCSPGVVAQTIEAINLFLAGEFPNVVFILAIEPAVVAAHVEVAHKDLVERLKGDRLSDEESSTLGWRFLEKIVQLPLSVPVPDERATLEYLDSLLGVADGSASAFATGAVTQTASRVVEQTDAQTLGDVPKAIEAARPAAASEGLTPEPVAQEVQARAFQRAYSDADPFVGEVIRKLARELPGRNAREMKRLLNLFRFYAFIGSTTVVITSAADERRLLERVGRLALLAIRWPYLLRVVARPGARGARGRGARSILLEDMERAARSTTAWEKLLLDAKLATMAGTPPAFTADAWAADLQEFCKGTPKIGRFARDFL
jgi:hypothetical protein